MKTVCVSMPLSSHCPIQKKKDIKQNHCYIKSVVDKTHPYHSQRLDYSLLSPYPPYFCSLPFYYLYI